MMATKTETIQTMLCFWILGFAVFNTFNETSVTYNWANNV
jgi:hypothetical protein